MWKEPKKFICQSAHGLRVIEHDLNQMKLWRSGGFLGKPMVLWVMKATKDPDGDETLGETCLQVNGQALMFCQMEMPMRTLVEVSCNFRVQLFDASPTEAGLFTAVLH